MVTIEKQRTLQITQKKSFLVLQLNSFCFFFCAQIPPVVSRSSLATIPSGMSREDDSGRSHSTKRGAFHEIFSLPETERPLPGALKKAITNSVSTYRVCYLTRIWNAHYFVLTQCVRTGGGAVWSIGTGKCPQTTFAMVCSMWLKSKKTLLMHPTCTVLFLLLI